MFCSAQGACNMPIMPTPQPPKTFLDPIDALDCPRVQLDYAITEKSPLGLDQKRMCAVPPFSTNRQAAKPASKLPLSPP